MEINENEISALKKVISEPKKVLVVSHINPDGDAIGSSLAWGSYLRTLGHEVTCVVPNKYPYFLEWMPGICDLKIYKNDADGSIAKSISEAEIIFCLDFNMIARLEGLGEAIEANKQAVKVLIDHHLQPDETFDIKLSHPESSSTSYLVYRLICELGANDRITKDMAEALYVGIMTDTGNFAFSFLTPHLFESVADLVRKGIDIPDIHNRVYNSFTEDRVRLLGYSLNKMESVKVNGTDIAFITLSEAEMRRFRFQQGDSEGFVNFPLTIKGMSMSAIFIENRHFIRISLRSRGDVDVSLFARLYFEGGGHKNASGGKSYRNMAQTVEYFKKCLNTFFNGKSSPEELPKT